jgi:hypothetical protein
MRVLLGSLPSSAKDAMGTHRSSMNPARRPATLSPCHGLSEYRYPKNPTVAQVFMIDYPLANSFNVSRIRSLSGIGVD